MSPPNLERPAPTLASRFVFGFSFNPTSLLLSPPLTETIPLPENATSDNQNQPGKQLTQRGY